MISSSPVVSRPSRSRVAPVASCLLAAAFAFAAAVALPLSGHAQIAAPSAATRAGSAKPSLKVAADRADAIYRQGETVTFTIRSTGTDAAAEAQWSISKDGVAPKRSGTVALVNGAASVTGSLDEPGFLLCQVTIPDPAAKPDAKEKTVKAFAGAAIDPLKIAPSLPVPDDFDAFWADKKNALAAIPVNARLTPVAPPKPADAAKIETFDLQADSLGAPVSGYYARPAGAKPGSLPAILTVHGAGVRNSILNEPAKWANRGLIALDINAHGLPNDKPASFYEKLSKGELGDYRTRGRNSRETIYFLGMYLRLVRAIDFLAAQPEWDGRTLIVSGTSQGGAQSIVAGGLDPRVTYISAGVPAICDNTGVLANRQRGWPKFLPETKAEAEKLPEAVQAVRYYDAMNFATRVKAEAYFTTGFIDTTCAPTSVYAAYNNLPVSGKKTIYNDIANGHGSSAACNKAKTDAILAYLATRK
ncbi:MAG: acetylxylan esterase [Opitutaceae bacterium]|jgi:cephalosporin-C deacetylase-like acetyl esterase|nr:acetylxylan esterase [Opitutaceae bacterium]